MYGKRIKRRNVRGPLSSQLQSRTCFRTKPHNSFSSKNYFLKSDWEGWKSKVKSFYRNSNTLLPLLVNKLSDNRPYISVNLFDYNIIGLLDSGANLSVIGSKSLDLVKSLNIKVNSSNLKQIVTADGTNRKVQGIIDLPMTIDGNVQIISFVIVPSLPHGFIFGSDFCRRFKLLINFKDSCWEIQSAISNSQINVLSNVSEIKEFAIPDNELSEVEKVIVNEVIHSFRTVSSENGLGHTNKIEMHIDIGESKPFKKRQYLMSPYMLKILNDELDEMIGLGVVEPSKSPYNSPVLLVKKASGEYRFCFDGRNLNQVTKHDSYPLPRIDRILNYIRGARYISCIDLRKAFWQIPLDESSREKTAFTVPGRGLFQFTVVPFGLCNSAQMQQRLVDSLFGPKFEPNIFSYLDDIVIVSSSLSEHVRLLKEVRNILHDANLTVNLDKCKFFQTSLKYLGFVIDREGIRTDPDKVSAMLNYPRPQTSTEVKRFVGMCSWYRRFIDDFAGLMAPINALLKGRKKKQAIEWTTESEDAFVKVKKALVSAPVLCPPDFSKVFTIQCDASAVAVGGVLVQELEGSERVIAYASRSLSRSERNYTVSERELLAVLFCLEKFRGYVEGTRFKVQTDHAALQFLNNLKDPCGRLARWAVKLNQYSFDIIYKKGSSNVVPDFLSRFPPDSNEVYKENSSDDHLDIFLIDIQPVETDKWYVSLRNKIVKNPDLYPQFKIENNCIFKYVPSKSPLPSNELEWKFVVPKSQRKQIIRSCHDPPQCAHFGFYKTLCRVQENYYFPKMRIDVLKFVKSCKICQAQKMSNSARMGLMGGEKPVQFPFQVIAVDIMGPFPRSPRGFSYLLVVGDFFSKYTLLFPMRDATANNVVKIMENSVFLVYGIPQFVICDNGPQFAGKTFKKLAETYQVQKIWYSPRYAAQCNFVERNNKTIGQAVRSYISEHRDWDKELPKIQFAINTSAHEVHNFSPAFLVFARHIPASGKFYGNMSDTQHTELCPDSRQKYVDNLSSLKEVFCQVKEKLHQAYLRNSKSYNLRKRDVSFKEGDWVWRRNRVLSDATAKFSAKLAPKYVLSKVRTKKSKLVYILENQDGSLAGDYHIKDLKPYFGSNSDVSVG